jgi:hypothetical protein
MGSDCASAGPEILPAVGGRRSVRAIVVLTPVPRPVRPAKAGTWPTGRERDAVAEEEEETRQRP